MAVTACPTGVAHTFMSAEALETMAKQLGHQIRVETQGSVGAQNALTAEEIASADLVFLATDIEVDMARFDGKPVYRTSTGAALKKPVPSSTRPERGQDLSPQRRQPTQERREGRPLQAPADRRLLHAADGGGGRPHHRALVRVRDRGLQGGRHPGCGPDEDRWRLRLCPDDPGAGRLHCLPIADRPGLAPA